MHLQALMPVLDQLWDTMGLSYFEVVRDGQLFIFRFVAGNGRIWAQTAHVDAPGGELRLSTQGLEDEWTLLEINTIRSAREKFMAFMLSVNASRITCAYGVS